MDPSVFRETQPQIIMPEGYETGRGKFEFALGYIGCAVIGGFGTGCARGTLGELGNPHNRALVIVLIVKNVKHSFFRLGTRGTLACWIQQWNMEADMRRQLEPRCSFTRSLKWPWKWFEPTICWIPLWPVLLRVHSTGDCHTARKLAELGLWPGSDWSLCGICVRGTAEESFARFYICLNFVFIANFYFWRIFEW